MARLTVAEREHWKDRISRKINQRIESLYASEPDFRDRTARQARQQALESLGLLETHRELDDLEAQQQRINQQRQRLHRAFLAQVRGVRPEELDPSLTPTRCHQDALQAVNRRQQAHERALLHESEVGREILRLEQERDSLTDTLWLATSSTEVRTLFQKVSELLEEKLTPLQQDAVTIPISE